VRGLYRFYEELALRFAEAGHAAVAVDYFGRTAGSSKRGEDYRLLRPSRHRTRRLAFDRALGEAGVEHELITYDGAPHSFFDRRQDDFADASADAWRRVLDFIERHSAEP
jgi:dienelactone hydrolase